jgi:enoyl-CoA hydratase/carnithine racemase
MNNKVYSDEEIRYSVLHEHVAIVTLNRPAARNAINPTLARAMEDLVTRTEGADEIRAIVLASSHETAFCAGADLGEISRGNAAGLATETGGFAGFVRAKRTKPWIAAVAGAAYGGGCEIALACDMIVAAPDSRFALPEVKRGLFAAAGGPLRATRALPKAIALELIATGEPLSGERAFAFGMVNRLAAAPAVLETAVALARVIAANAPLAVRESLTLARRVPELSEAAFWDQSDALLQCIFASDDAREGPVAFFEKRPPRWTGR